MDKNQKVGEVVSKNIKTAHIFKKYGIDFCCGGGISIEKACEKNQQDVNKLLDELMNLTNDLLPSQQFINWELDFLIDYIIHTHHKYVNESIELLDFYTAKVARVHGSNYPVLIEIENLYTALKGELIPHMIKEENILFPYIKGLVTMKKGNAVYSQPTFVTVNYPIRMMVNEHEMAGDIMLQINELSLGYQAPEWACNTFKAMYAKLKEFEEDLHLHVHLENNILFPKAIELENELQDSLDY